VVFQRPSWDCYPQMHQNRQPLLFPHWGLEGRLNNRSRMNGDIHVRIWEGVEVRFLCSTRLIPESAQSRLRNLGENSRLGDYQNVSKNRSRCV
jgi:hypothetical protein